ncbi:hypothetical protein [Pseudomonas chlororaphis]|uniref:Uncharacterized protein n=1 Tax=Pseudomonas chlororaphis TaxID=587753 RepID=A0AAX3FUM1_9PSED|nr:hypothetical protein [Pseudomonas chlororaphis]AZC39729.1 hypothetical protein C4K37_5366 [Pseudomonas chlororaphis subsp. piscium]AZC46281.1 hypothetical protein C4K36_5380 [Pseudomonas chlororaphis subsp. piscium]WDG71801.1 hypothetical protein PUP65_27450 [Pseudomonas chlororaphis]WDH30416.1 hypothetical protein PUP81_06870 [Pseudomonas chlororaphis]WDH70326.1 hypothetical protein PUP78_27435 [Pseudomonas chlororaphis]
MRNSESRWFKLILIIPLLACAGFTIRWNIERPLDVTVVPPDPVKAPTISEVVEEVKKTPGNILKETTKGAENIVREAGIGGKNVLSELGIAASNISNEGNKGAENIARETAKAILDIGKSVQKAGEDTEATLAKAGKDVEWNIAKAGRDSEDAIHAIGHFIENQAQSQGKIIDRAAERFREGKFVDAMWHYSMEQFQETENNAAKAAQESQLIAQAGQVAAQAYGGPGGSAAFAAWLTYKQTGDLNLALKTGIITGASAMAMAEAGKMPSTGEEYALARKTIVTAAIGGATVAVAGGDATAVREGFLLAGSMVLVQDHYQKITSGQAELDRESMMVSKSESAYCMSPNQEFCQPLRQGEVLRDRRVPSVGVEGSNNPLIGDNGVLMKNVVSKVPGMQGMSVMHDQWVVQWDLNRLNLNQATIAPAIVVYYAGTGAPYYEHLRRTSMEKQLAEQSAILTSKPMSAQARAVYNQPSGVAVTPSRVSQSYICTKGSLGRQFAVELASKDSDFSCRVVSNISLVDQYSPTVVHWIARNDVTFCGRQAMISSITYKSAGWQCHFLPPAAAVAEMTTATAQ